MSNNDILREFLLETHENLSLLDSDLVKLESNPDEKATLAQVFRTLHSVKGTAGFMGLVKLQAVAHSAESLLGRLRSGEIRFNRPIATALLRVVDAIREILANIESSNGEGSGDYSALAAEVDQLRLSGGVEESIATLPAGVPAQTLSIEAPVPPHGLQPPPKPPSSEPPAPDATISMSISLPPIAEATDARPSAVAEAAIRVDVGLLDKLMTLVGELVLARNQILQ